MRQNSHKHLNNIANYNFASNRNVNEMNIKSSMPFSGNKHSAANSIANFTNNSKSDLMLPKLNP